MPTEIPAATAFEREAGVKLSREAADAVDRACARMHLTPGDLFNKWEVHAMKLSRGKAPPTPEDISAIITEHERTSDVKPGTLRKRVVGNVSRRGPAMAPIVEIDDFFSAYVSDDDGAVARGKVKVEVEVEEKIGDEAEAMDVDDAGDEEREAVSPGNGPREGGVIQGGARLAGRSFDSASALLPGDDVESVREAFVKRADKAKVLTQFNGGVNGVSATSSPATPARVRVLPRYGDAPADDPFLYMNDDLNSVAESVRERLRVVSERILARRSVELKKAGREDAARAPSIDAFFSASPNLALAAGRIRVELDGDAGGGGKINPSSVILESEDGHLIKLNFARVKAAKQPFLLNPGMIVVVEGINTNGRIFDVHAIYDNSIPLQDVELGTSKGAAAAAAYDEGMAPVARVIVAAGPYTLPGNLCFEPLDELLSTVMSSKPDTVVLMGPFLDIGHHLVDETLPVEFDSIFESRVLGRISEAASRLPETTFVVVPSLNDVHHEFVCPQPPFRIRDTSSIAPSICFMSNPCAITVSDAANKRAAILGISSLPALLDMSADSLCSDTGDRFRALASHMIKQWSFYPPFPASAGVPLDSTHSERLELPDCGVDAIITPSKLQPFVKGIDSDVVAINPGMLTRGAAGGGGFAEIALPLHRTTDEFEKPTSLKNRLLNTNTVCVEIRRL